MPVARAKPITLAELGVSDAPLTRCGLDTCMRFFERYLPGASREKRLRFLRAVDLHKPVKETTLMQGAKVAAFRRSLDGEFYTKPGTSVHDLGINPATRVFQRYELRMAATVLESRCAAARDDWTDSSIAYVANGGGIQYIIPNPDCVLTRVG